MVVASHCGDEDRGSCRTEMPSPPSVHRQQRIVIAVLRGRDSPEHRSEITVPWARGPHHRVTDDTDTTGNHRYLMSPLVLLDKSRHRPCSRFNSHFTFAN